MNPIVEQEERTPKQIFHHWLEIVILAILFALILRAYVFQGYKIPTIAMENTLFKGDYAIGEKITYKIRKPKRGEIVVFRYPLNPDKIFIKRCVGVAGDTVVVRDKVLYINGNAVPDYPGVKYTDPELLSAIYSSRDNCGPIIVPYGYIFVMGDNRDKSSDSRFWGSLPLKNVDSRLLFIYFSLEPDNYTLEKKSIFNIIRVILHKIVTFPIRIRWHRIGKFIEKL